MPDALAVSPPAAPPSAPKAAKAPADKAESADGKDTEAREFADALEQAVEAPASDAASVDPTAAIPAGEVPVIAVDPAAPVTGGELGVGGAPPMDNRHPAVLLPLRPEARAALRAAMPEANAAPRAELPVATAADSAVTATDDDAPRFGAAAAPGKPFELLVERAAASTIQGADAADTGEIAATESRLPAATDGAAETARRDRPAVLRLETQLPVHSPRFAEGFNQQVVVLAQHGIQQAQLSLTPPDLGPVDVRITVANDEASVQIAAHSGVAREAIQDALPRLKDMMEQSGVRLNDASVFTQLPERDQTGGAQQRADWWQQQHGRQGGTGEIDDGLPVPVTIRHHGLIDAYA